MNAPSPIPGTPGILLANFGGPRSVEEIPIVLRDLFNDPDLFDNPLGPLGQRALAEMIIYFRTPRVEVAYRRIGGASPLVALTEQQAGSVRMLLAEREIAAPVAIAMRYGFPTIAEGVKELRDAGVDRILLAPMYPHYSISTVGSTINEMRRVIAKHAPGLPWDTLPQFPIQPGFIASFASQIQQTLDKWDAARLTGNRVLMFTAHGLPQSFVDQGDPYPRQIRATAAALVQAVGYVGRWEVTFQSRVGPVEWLKPYTDEAIPQWADEGVDGIIAVPISFVADNLESREEIDHQYRKLAAECGISAFATVPCVNVDPAWCSALTDMLIARLAKPGPIPVQCMLPGKRMPVSQLIGFPQAQAAKASGDHFRVERLHVTAPWWKWIRKRTGPQQLIRYDRASE